jgi:hypothetical protein
VARAAEAPFAMIAWVGAAASAPALSRVPAIADGGHGVIAVRLVRDHATVTTLLRPGDTAERVDRSASVDDYETDARLLQYSLRGSTLVSLALADAMRAVARRPGLLSVTADSRIEDLHIAVAGDTLLLTASRALPRLQLNGDVMAGVRRVQLNGRDITMSRPTPLEATPAGTICAA